MLLLQARDLNLSQSSRQDGASRFAFQKLTTAQTLARATESLVCLLSTLFFSTFNNSPRSAAAHTLNMKLCCFPAFPRAHFLFILQHHHTSMQVELPQRRYGSNLTRNYFTCQYFIFPPGSTEAHQHRPPRLHREVVLDPGCQRGAQAAADSSLRHQQPRRGEGRRHEAGKGLLQEHREDGLRHPPEGPGHRPGCGC